eukprot:2019355-Amphidinium_carterae.1
MRCVWTHRCDLHTLTTFVRRYLEAVHGAGSATTSPASSAPRAVDVEAAMQLGQLDAEVEHLRAGCGSRSGICTVGCSNAPCVRACVRACVRVWMSGLCWQGNKPQIVFCVAAL